MTNDNDNAIDIIYMYRVREENSYAPLKARTLVIGFMMAESALTLLTVTPCVAVSIMLILLASPCCSRTQMNLSLSMVTLLNEID